MTAALAIVDRLCIFSILLACCSALPCSNAQAAEIARLKDLHLETQLAARGKPVAAIVAPAGGRYDAAVAVVQKAVKQAAGVELPLLADTAGEPKDLLRDRPLIVLGNMSTSRVLFTLYRNYYAFTDLKYPGRGGWEVRSLHDPYATGHNVILLGGSDDAGVLAAAEHFAAELQAGDPLKVGWLLKVRLGSDVPKPPEIGETVYSWRDSYRLDAQGKYFGNGPSGVWGWSPIGKPAVLYYMTGDEKYLREFLRLALPDPENLPKELRSLKVETAIRGHAMPEFGIKRPLRMVHHYHAHLMPMLWDLIEESPRQFPVVDEESHLGREGHARVDQHFHPAGPRILHAHGSEAVRGQRHGAADDERAGYSLDWKGAGGIEQAAIAQLHAQGVLDAWRRALCVAGAAGGIRLWRLPHRTVLVAVGGDFRPAALGPCRQGVRDAAGETVRPRAGFSRRERFSVPQLSRGHRADRPAVPGGRHLRRRAQSLACVPYPASPQWWPRLVARQWQPGLDSVRRPGRQSRGHCRRA